MRPSLLLVQVQTGCCRQCLLLLVLLLLLMQATTCFITSPANCAARGNPTHNLWVFTTLFRFQVKECTVLTRLIPNRAPCEPPDTTHRGRGAILPCQTDFEQWSVKTGIRLVRSSGVSGIPIGTRGPAFRKHDRAMIRRCRHMQPIWLPVTLRGGTKTSRPALPLHSAKNKSCLRQTRRKVSSTMYLEQKHELSRCPCTAGNVRTRALQQVKMK